MTIVNPYLKRKTTIGTGTGTTRSPSPSASASSNLSKKGTTPTKNPAIDEIASKPSKTPFVTTTPAKVVQPGTAQARTNVVTPQAKAGPRIGAPSSSLASTNTGTGTVVTPNVRSTSTKPTTLRQQPTNVVKQAPSIRPPTTAPDQHQRAGTGGGASVVRQDRAVITTAAASAPKKLTLKQKLKQEITALKKQKQLIQMQKEAQERRKRAELERAAKEEERQRFLQARQAELQARQEEKLRRRQEKQDAMERKRLERLAQQQAAVAKQEQAQKDYQQALTQYHRDLEEYQSHHARWLNERQQWMKACQQKYTMPSLYSQTIPGVSSILGYPQLPQPLISGGIVPGPAYINQQGTASTSQSTLPTRPSVPSQLPVGSTFPGTVCNGIHPDHAHATKDGSDSTSKMSLVPAQNPTALVNSDSIQSNSTNTVTTSSESNSQPPLPLIESASAPSTCSASLSNDTIQPILATTSKQLSDTNSLSSSQMVPTQSNAFMFCSPHTTTPTTIPSFPYPQFHSGWVSPYHAGTMAPHPTPYPCISNASSTSFMHYMARDQGILLAPSQSYLPPHVAQNPYYSGTPYVSQAVANMTYIMSLMPSHLKIPPTPPIPPRKPKCCIPKKKPEVVEQPLGAVMEPPSPYAATHVLLNVTLIRSLDQPSYGVNLKALTTTVLVDVPTKDSKPPVPDKMQSNDEVDQPTHASKPNAQQGLQVDASAMNVDGQIVDGVTQCEASNHNLNEDTNMVREVNDELNPSEDKSITTSKPNLATRVKEEEMGATEGIVTSVENGSLPIKEDSTLNDSSTSSESPIQDKTSIQVKSEPPVTTTTTYNATVSEEKKNLPRKPRRRRINFTVMTVVDADKQNARWQELGRQVNESVDADKESGTVLEPGDIIVSIGGKDVAGCSFVDACAIFAQMSLQTTTTTPQGESQAVIQAKLVVARKKQVPMKAKNEKVATIKFDSITNSNSPSNSDSQPLRNSSKPDNALSRPLLNTKALSSPANASLSFSIAEIAVLADGVIQAIHDQPTSRLLGQELSAAVLSNKTTIFRRVASLNDCILSHRSAETLFAKWSQLCQSMSTSLAEESRAAWNRQALLLETANELSSLSYSSDAERTALRQLPRPTKGCRCQRQDHEYLHDVRCTLYKDICRLLPPEELSELQHDPNRIQKSKVDTTPRDLKTVETAFKDRVVKLKTAAEMEEMEARFVARMEEVQVKQLRKAIFAPNLTSMVLSSIMDLQREFPDIAGPSLENNDDESDDESLDDELLLSGKRKPSTSNKGSKKMKVNQVKSINFKYLTRIVQHIGKTWGHVYREPSHEDYAWRWELFHGHNTEGTPWDSQSTNPRNPNSLTFEYLGNGLEILDKKSAHNLAKASEAIADLEDALQIDMLKPRTPPAAESDSTAAAAADCKEVSSKVDPMDVDDQATPVTSTSPTSEEVENTKKSEARLELSDKVVEQLCLAAYLLSPSSSGFYDEILALVQMGVIDISKRGIPYLPEDWASKVDSVVLEDMDAAWGSDSDPEGRYCINLDFRDSLEQEWIKTNRGWALAFDPDDVIYELDVMDEWRDFFQGQLEEKANVSEGIGRFGL